MKTLEEMVLEQSESEEFDLVTNPPYANIEYYVDLDGVLVDLDKGVELLSGLSFKTHSETYGIEKTWELINAQGSIWWATLPWTPDGKELWNVIKHKPNVKILTSCSAKNGPNAKEGKQQWINKQLGFNVDAIIVDTSTDKQLYSGPGKVLIDDLESNISEWNAAGGFGMLHKNSNTTLSKLKQLNMI